MHKFWQFIQYHNAIPIVLFVLFGGAGAAFAASPEAQKAVYDTHDVVQSVDNTYIVGVNLDNRDFGLRITDIREDNENYYVSYTYNTIAVVDYVWQETPVVKDATFSKKELTGRDLGLFLAKQLGEEINAQLAFLQDVQKQEQEKGSTLKKVATEYTGLIGRMLDPTEKEFPGYSPVVEETIGVDSGASAAAAVALAGSGESHDALPGPVDIDAIVAAAVANALAAQNGTANTTDMATATTTDSNGDTVTTTSTGFSTDTVIIPGSVITTTDATTTTSTTTSPTTDSGSGTASSTTPTTSGSTSATTTTSGSSTDSGATQTDTTNTSAASSDTSSSGTNDSNASTTSAQ